MSKIVPSVPLIGMYQLQQIGQIQTTPIVIDTYEQSCGSGFLLAGSGNISFISVIENLLRKKYICDIMTLVNKINPIPDQTHHISRIRFQVYKKKQQQKKKNPDPQLCSVQPRNIPVLTMSFFLPF